MSCQKSFASSSPELTRGDTPPKGGGATGLPTTPTLPVGIRRSPSHRVWHGRKWHAGASPTPSAVEDLVPGEAPTSSGDLPGGQATSARLWTLFQPGQQRGLKVPGSLHRRGRRPRVPAPSSSSPPPAPWDSGPAPPTTRPDAWKLPEERPGLATTPARTARPLCTYPVRPADPSHAPNLLKDVL